MKYQNDNSIAMPRQIYAFLAEDSL